MNAAWLGLAARALLGLVLVFSGTMKTAGPVEEFAVIIDYYRILPEGSSMAAAAIIPWIEILAGLALALGYFTRQAAAAAGAMLGVFILAIVSTKVRGFELPSCGCFGHGVHLTQTQAILVDSGLLAMAFAAFKSGSRNISLDNWIASGL